MSREGPTTPVRRTRLERVPTSPRPLEAYAALAPADLLAEIHEIAADLRGLRIVQVNATAAGGGVAELLGSLIPLARRLGLEVEWRLLCPDDAFFAATKHLHNALRASASR
jgi:trehalose synthase